MKKCTLGEATLLYDKVSLIDLGYIANFIRNLMAKEFWWIGSFLADRTNGRAIGTLLRPSSSSVTLCIVAKRCVLEQKLLLRAYRKLYMRNRLVPKWMTTFV